jgi:hypothetical protein
MHAWQSVVEWLHEHPSRRILIVAAGYHDEEGNWHPKEGAATFELNTRLPDGRQVASRVQILDEIMMEPLASDMIVHEAKMAIAALLAREPA